MKSVEIDPAIQADSSLSELVEFVNKVWEDETAKSRLADEVSGSWTLERDDAGKSMLRLTVTDGSSRAEAIFPPISPPDHLNFFQRRINQLWRDYLQARSHKLLEDLSGGETPANHLDGDEALERIIDSLTEYREREGHEPESIKLPIRYATALMKLGPSYWGEFYREIWKSGLRAFEGQNLLGMKVELVPGIDAELQVA